MEDKIAKPHILSYCSLFLEVRSGEHNLGIATGFTYGRNSRTFLITNWHVVTGRNPKSKQLLNDMGMEPTDLITWFHVKHDNHLTWQSFISPLSTDDGRPKWHEHPVHGSKVDVVAMHIANPEKLRLFPINERKFEDFRLEISQDVFILGFPRGITGAGKLPIWKRGTIATEPEIDLDGLPKLLIDSATREGMSGSPVIARYTGYYQHSKDKPSLDDWFGQAERFLGIYSGRIVDKDDEFAAQLGIVWKAKVIDEIIDAIKF